MKNKEIHAKLVCGIKARGSLMRELICTYMEGIHYFCFSGDISEQ